MVEAQKLLSIDMMTAHWEFTYGAKRVEEIVTRDLKGHSEFLAHNMNEPGGRFDFPAARPCVR